MMWYWGGGTVHWWGWFIGFLVSLAFWAFIIFLLISVVRSFGSRDHNHTSDATSTEDPERALARRFANGEIDEEEFHRRLDVLRSHHAGSA